jgi:hypothetical protein
MKSARQGHADLAAAVERKRNLPTIDRLVSDAALDAHLYRHGGLDGSNKLTLGTALVSGSGVACSLELQLCALIPHVWRGRTSRLAANLLNDSEQFRNTRAELGLAHFMLQGGGSIHLDEEFHTGKDADIVLQEGSGERRFVDVVSLAHDPIVSGFADINPECKVAKEMWGKVVNKYESKFKEAKEAGWAGSAWVALNFAQNERIYLEHWLRNVLGKPAWLVEVEQEIKARAPGLDGVAYFVYMGTIPSAESVTWLPLK